MTARSTCGREETPGRRGDCLDQLPTRTFRLLVHPAHVDLPTSTLHYLTAHLRTPPTGTDNTLAPASRRTTGTAAYPRCGHTYTQLTARFSGTPMAPTGTSCEGIEVLAALAPGLAETVKAASTKAFVIHDGTPLPIDRIAADRPFLLFSCARNDRKHGPQTARCCAAL